ncbi:MAG: hypothetical protein LBK60_03410 [Verrucomicrobiales bacterium]|jgi:hypothetical protein|nr:hypothetical protein [Verrucomicrobiales bacterium]
MNTPALSILLTVSAGLAPLTLTAAIMPVPPAQLLALMPATPPDWTLKQSHAANGYQGWPECNAFRLMEGPVYPADPAEQKPSPAKRSEDQGQAPATPLAQNPDPFPANRPATLRVRLTDTGQHAPKLARFANFTTGAGRLMIHSMPAIQRLLPDHQRTTICINRRFILSIEGRNMPGKVYQDFIKQLDLSAIAGIPNDGPATFTRPLIIVQVDELNPANSGTYKLYWANPEEANER